MIDGGNSNYEDTNRRVALAEARGFRFVGAGVSGGEEGALNGASIMPGGSESAWSEVKPILQSIAAKASDGTRAASGLSCRFRSFRQDDT